MHTIKLNTEITPLDLPWMADFGVHMDMKRDDLIHPFISGNKWRKLKGIVADAFETGAEKWVTFGGAWSNHLLATACAGAQMKVKTYGFVRGEKVSNPVLSLCSLFGMELAFVDRDRYRDKELLFDTFAASNPRSYMIDEGGYSPQALLGVAEIIHEIPINTYDHIFCACGTGTTVAGLAQGIAEQGNATSPQLHGVAVVGADLRPDITRLYQEIDFQWHDQYTFGGYAKTKPPLLAFIRQFCAHTGILIEPVYTGKLCFAVCDLIEKKVIKPGERILILHSGGLTGLLGMHEKFSV